ncbi:MAG: LysM peptidoglycan-binding domain-containing protein [Actinobacteria bacterium]|nr:LysM peptidoglycan-binding domain-containing protein [Actinomycetota bacterium]
MPSPAGPPQSDQDAESGHRLDPVLLAAIGLVVLLVAIVLVAATTLTGAEPAESAGEKAPQQSSKLPASYTVRKGDSYGSIAQRVGVKVEDLERFNPYVNPSTIRPGQRLKLRATPPKVKKRGPIFHKVRKGDTFGSIAFRWGRTVPRLKELNPKLKETALQPGDRVRLRK